MVRAIDLACLVVIGLAAAAPLESAATPDCQIKEFDLVEGERCYGKQQNNSLDTGCLEELTVETLQACADTASSLTCERAIDGVLQTLKNASFRFAAGERFHVLRGLRGRGLGPELLDLESPRGRGPDRGRDVVHRGRVPGLHDGPRPSEPGRRAPAARAPREGAPRPRRPVKETKIGAVYAWKRDAGRGLVMSTPGRERSIWSASALAAAGAICPPGRRTWPSAMRPRRL